ncbi:MAG TPA: DUF2125 domain-containing protein [Beijerinckia sp.]|jgi:hypothetical protein|nr:DUF2125 domain-containing protein [Beijerinckia sp.]
MQASGTKTPKIRSVSKFRIAVSVGVLILVTIGWSALWFIAARKTQDFLDLWMKQEAQAGRIWTCPERDLGGFPFEIMISCANPHFEGEVYGKVLTGTLQGFRAASSIFRPAQVRAQMDSPFTARTSDATFDFTVNWAQLNLVLEGQPHALLNASITADELGLQGDVEGLGAIGGRVAKAKAQAAAAPDRQDHAYDFGLRLEGAEHPALEAVLGSSIPVDVGLAGTLTQASFNGRGEPAALIEDWRAAGGRIDLSTVQLTQAQTKFDAKGNLGLDAAHRVEGRLDAQFSGFEPALRRLGVNPALVNAGALLNGLLGKKPPGAVAADAPQPLRLPLTLANGWLSIGPVRTPIALPPLY